MRYIIIFFVLLLMFIGNAIHEDAKKKKIGLRKIVIDHGLELYNNLQNHESDCFKKVTIKFLHGCDSLHFDTIENMDYAVMLTLCELDTAQIPIPSACSPLLNEAEDRKGHVKKCVHKMARLPQTWTTYSGYFRDVALMCFAIHSPLEKDILEKLHTNITLNQVKNFGILQQQQELLITWRNDEFKTLGRLKESQLKVLNQMDTMHLVHSKTADQIESIFETLVLLQNQTKAIVVEYNQLVQYSIKEMQTQLNQLVIRQGFEVNEVIDAVIGGLKLIDRNIEKMVAIQQETILNWSRNKDLQSVYLDNWVHTMDKLNISFSQVLNRSLEGIQLLTEDISVLHNQLNHILAPFQWTIGTIMNFRGVFLNTAMYVSFFYHMLYLFKSHNRFMKPFLSIGVTIGHQYTIHNIFSVYNKNPHEETIKISIILVEWLIRELLSRMGTGTTTPDRYGGSSLSSSSTASPSSSSSHDDLGK